MYVLRMRSTVTANANHSQEKQNTHGKRVDPKTLNGGKYPQTLKRGKAENTIPGFSWNAAQAISLTAKANSVTAKANSLTAKANSLTAKAIRSRQKQIAHGKNKSTEWRSVCSLGHRFHSLCFPLTLASRVTANIVYF